MSFTEASRNFDSYRNKVHPPSVDPIQILVREELIHRTLLPQLRRKRIVTIEACAGQGKSTLALHLAEALGRGTAWYQADPDDSDPFRFLKTLIVSLSALLPSQISSYFDRLDTSEDVSYPSLLRHLKVFISHLGVCLSDDLCLVIDDIHQIEEGSQGMALLNALVEEAPKRLHFILISRVPILLPVLVSMEPAELFCLKSQDLEFSAEDTALLYNDILKISLPFSQILEIRRQTEGWVMGLLLKGYAHRLGAPQEAPGRLDVASAGGFADYFKKTIFPYIPARLRFDLYRLSLLETIPSALACRIAGDEKILADLDALAARNTFIRRADPDGQTFLFHHLFREALRLLCREGLPTGEIERVCAEAARYHRDEGDVETSLAYLVRGGDLQSVDDFLKAEGFSLLQRVRSSGLARILSCVSPEKASDFGWISFFRGLIALESTPSDAKGFFENASILFAQNGDAVGRCLAASQSIHYLIVVECRFERGGELLSEAEARFDDLCETLDPHVAAQAAINLAMGCIFFLADIDRARVFLDFASKTARAFGLVNVEATICFVNGMGYAMTGRCDAFEAESENASTLLAHAGVHSFTKFLLHVMISNYYVLTGDHENLQRQSELILRECENDLTAKSSIESWQMIFRADSRLAQGRYREALVFIGRAREGFGADLPHMRSHFLQYDAFIRAHLGENDGIEEAASEAYALRLETGGVFYRIFNAIMVGATSALVGAYDSAERILCEGVDLAEGARNRYFIAAARFNRAFSRLRAGDRAGATADLAEALRSMREQSMSSFFGWSPQIAKEVLSEAVRQKIESDYAACLAADRLGLAFLEDGSEVPLLEVRMLGGLAVGIRGETRCADSDFSPLQREFLAILAASPDHTISQERLQEFLWPDSSPEKARGSFDVFLSRMRKLLDQALGSKCSQNYLVLKRGILSLCHCRIDAVQFSSVARWGLSRRQKAPSWSAGNHLYRAFLLWRGEFMPHVIGCDIVRDYRMELERTFVALTLKWGCLLIACGQSHDAVEVLERGLAVDPCNIEVLQQLYRIYLQKGDIPSARATIERCAAKMRQEGFSDHEVQSSIEVVCRDFS